MISAKIEDEQKLVVHHTVEYCNRFEKKEAKQIHVDNFHSFKQWLSIIF